MNVFEVLAGRVIVHTDPIANVIITWNKSCTYQFYTVNGADFQEYNIITRSNETRSFEEACKFARKYYQEDI